MFRRIGLALSIHDYDSLVNASQTIDGVYLINDWNGLGEIDEMTTDILFSREWFITQGIDSAENLLSLVRYYKELNIEVYYFNIHFDQSDTTHLCELNELLRHDFYNILLGNHYELDDILHLSTYKMSQTDWEEWLIWLSENQSYFKANTMQEEFHFDDDMIVFEENEEDINGRRNLSDKTQGALELYFVLKDNLSVKVIEIADKITEIKNEGFEFGQQKLSQLKNKETFSEPNFEKEPFNIKEWITARLDVDSIKEKIADIWVVYKKFYLKGSIFIVLGVIVAGMGMKPLIEMSVNSKNAVEEWESIKQRQSEAMIPDEKPVLEDSKGLTENTNKETDLIGLIKIPNKENAVGVRLGTSNAILTKGAGLDESSAMSLGERGNAVVYGHREEVFWELKNIKKGDIITVETLDGTYKYEVKETRVTYPEDETIYQYTKKNMLTLVTCHPFVYMGATPERFVVEAELVEKEV